jgi:hypothetical protein
MNYEPRIAIRLIDTGHILIAINGIKTTLVDESQLALPARA